MSTASTPCASFCARRSGERLAAQLGRDLPQRTGRDGPYSIEAEAIGRRALKNLALGYLVASGSDEGGRLCVAAVPSTPTT